MHSRLRGEQIKCGGANLSGLANLLADRLPLVVLVILNGTEKGL